MLQAAIIGTGAIAREHLSSLRALPDVVIAGVCDLSPALAEATAEEFGCPTWTTDHRELLERTRPDVVHVTTPPHTHFALAVDALEAGAHVFVEKPIAHDAEELYELFERGRLARRMVVEDHNYAFNEPVRRLLEMKESGELGEVTHVEVAIALDITGAGSRYCDANLPHPCLKLPGGAIADFLTHLSYLAYLFVGPHRAVRTSWRKRDESTPLPSDELRALVDAEHGTAVLSFSSHSQPDAFTLRVWGTKLRATASLFEPLLAVESLREGPRPLMPVKNGLAMAKAHKRAGLGGLWRKLSGKPMSYEGLYDLVRRVYRAVELDLPAPVPPEQIQQVTRLVCDLTREENRL